MEKNNFSVSVSNKTPTRSALAISRRSFIRGIVAAVLTAAPHHDVISAQIPEKEMTRKPLPSVTDATFEKTVLRSQKPMLVEWYADWCGPCRNMETILEELQQEFGESIVILRMNVDTNTTDVRYRKKQHERLIPYCLYFTHGEATDSGIGAETKGQMRIRIKRLIETHAKSRKTQ